MYTFFQLSVCFFFLFLLLHSGVCLSLGECGKGRGRGGGGGKRKSLNFAIIINYQEFSMYKNNISADSIE